MPVYVYLRAIKHGRSYHLAMFDSNGDGAIDNLTTIVRPGYTIYWKLDRYSRIARINKIYSTQRGRKIFASPAAETPRGFSIHIPRRIDMVSSNPFIVKYIIDCTLLDEHKRLKIDPFIKIQPPL